MKCGIPYGMPPVGGLTAVSGQINVFKLQFPSRSVITKIVVVQESGQNQGFTASLFNNEGAAGNIAQSESTDDTTGVLSEELFRVSNDMTADGTGKIQYFAELHGGLGYTFFNNDNVHNNRMSRLGNARTIYLRIVPGGTGTKKFSALLEGFTIG